MLEKIHFNSFLCPSADVRSPNHLVILNSDSFCPKLTAAMWSKCDIKVCADGGANRLYDSLLPDVRSKFVPQYIVGDLDSLRTEVKEFYKERGSIVKRVASQEENDLDKSVLLIRAVIETGSTSYIDGLGVSVRSGKISHIGGDSFSVSGGSEPVDGPSVSVESGESSGDCLVSDAIANISPLECTVVLMGAYGGRFDQEMAAVSSMFRWLHVFDRMVLVGSNACSFLLQPGFKHRIRPVDSLHLRQQPGVAFAKEGPTCGLIPIGGKVESLTSSGLEWDMHGASLQLGVLVSSSNSILPGTEEVTVETSDTVLWTVQVHVL